jgi:hypothetical protein
MSEGKMTVISPFDGCLPGRFVRTMEVSIGGFSKEALFKRVEPVRQVSPYAKRLMKHERFTTLSDKSTILQIMLTPEDLGFSDRPTIAAMLDNARLAKWSLTNLKGWRVELNPPEVGPQLAIQYKGQPQNEFLWIAMERIPGSGGRPYIFYLERNDEDLRSLDAHWTYPYALWRLDYLVSFRLVQTPETSP